MKRNDLRKITVTAVLSALALISFVIENLFPPLFFPGARMGIANVFILLAVIYVGVPYGYLALIVKSVLGSLFIGNISAIAYSLPSGAVALTVEILLIKKSNTFGLPSISVFGAVINATLQNAIFCVVTGVYGYMAYSPYLTAISVVSGLLIGLIVTVTVKRLPASVFSASGETKNENHNGKEN